MSPAHAANGVAHDTPLLTALRDAQRVLYDSRRYALAVIAMLDKMNIADAMGSKIGTDDYDLVFGVERLLAQLRDEADAEVSKIESLVRRTEVVQGDTQ